MRDSKNCPKCNSKNILRVPGKHYGYGAGNIIHTGMSALSAVKVTRYVCEECGFSEEWIDNKEDIVKLIKKYK